jgi:predicted ATPase
MLKKIDIHHFRYFENFEIAFDKLNLFIEANGVGKSAISHIIHKIQSLINHLSTVQKKSPPCLVPMT